SRAISRTCRASNHAETPHLAGTHLARVLRPPIPNASPGPGASELPQPLRPSLASAYRAVRHVLTGGASAAHAWKYLNDRPSAGVDRHRDRASAIRAHARLLPFRPDEILHLAAARPDLGGRERLAVPALAGRSGSPDRPPARDRRDHLHRLRTGLHERLPDLDDPARPQARPQHPRALPFHHRAGGL